MKLSIAVAVGLSALADGAAASHKSVGATFGPKGCVMLTRSSEGSCVLSTECEGADLAHTEFAFNCVGATKVVRHSFGMGGFENEEEFDTEVKCDRCESSEAKPVPPPKAEVAPKAPAKVEAPAKVAGAVVFHAGKATAHTQSHAAVKAESKAQSSFWPFTSAKKEVEKTKYGPNGCVSTWRNSQGHCMIQTDCKKKDLGKYEFGLVCVDRVGAPVKHLFGKDSFDPEETFDTLIKCDKCLGLEDIPDDVALNGEVSTMSRDISNLKAVMQNISTNVKMLNEEVFKSAPAAAPAPGPASANAPAAAVSFSVHEGLASAAAALEDKNQATRNLRASQKHVADDEDDEDQDEDRSDEDGSDED